MKHVKEYEGVSFKTYIYKYEDWYWFSDDVNGDMLVSDPQDASIFSEKHTNDIDIDKTVYIDSMYTEDEEIEITHPFEKIEI